MGTKKSTSNCIISQFGFNSFKSLNCSEDDFTWKCHYDLNPPFVPAQHQKPWSSQQVYLLVISPKKKHTHSHCCCSCPCTGSLNQLVAYGPWQFSSNQTVLAFFCISSYEWAVTEWLPLLQSSRFFQLFFSDSFVTSFHMRFFKIITAHRYKNRYTHQTP